MGNETSIPNSIQLQWTPISVSGDAPAPREAHCSAVFGNRLFIFGGTI
jgi:hypothetical protein